MMIFIASINALQVNPPFGSASCRRECWHPCASPPAWPPTWRSAAGAHAVVAQHALHTQHARTQCLADHCMVHSAAFTAWLSACLHCRRGAIIVVATDAATRLHYFDKFFADPSAGERSLRRCGTQLRPRWRAVRGRRQPSGAWLAGCTPATRCACLSASGKLCTKTARVVSAWPAGCAHPTRCGCALPLLNSALQ